MRAGDTHDDADAKQDNRTDLDVEERHARGDRSPGESADQDHETDDENDESHFALLLTNRAPLQQWL
jgi:hypothetical protein